MCIFTTKSLSKWKTTTKSRWFGVDTIYEVVLMQLLIQYFLSFEGVTPLFVTLCHIFDQPPSPVSELHTFWMDPYVLQGQVQVSFLEHVMSVFRVFTVFNHFASYLATHRSIICILIKFMFSPWNEFYCRFITLIANAKLIEFEIIKILFELHT